MPQRQICCDCVYSFSRTPMHTARTLYYSWSLALAASISPPRRDVIPVHHIVPSSDLEYYES